MDEHYQGLALNDQSRYTLYVQEEYNRFTRTRRAYNSTVDTR